MSKRAMRLASIDPEATRPIAFRAPGWVVLAADEITAATRESVGEMYARLVSQEVERLAQEVAEETAILRAASAIRSRLIVGAL